MAEQILFEPFEGEPYPLQRATNANISAVCRVMASCKHLDAEDIAYYEQLGGIPEQDKVYTAATYPAALAEVLFVGFPTLVNRGKKAVKVDAKNDELDRGEVVRAFDFFLNYFGAMSHTAHATYSLSKVIQSLTNEANMTSELEPGDKPG